jgi:hypothetical protein
MKNLHFVALALTTLSCSALADDSGLFYAAGGVSKGGANVSLGAGTNVDVLEISSINLGSVSGNSSAKFVGLSLVQNTTPANHFNLLFRVGFGRTTTSFADGASATRVGYGNGVIFGVGGQYQLARHVALRGEVNRISYATSEDGRSSKLSYPVTLSAIYLF